MAAAVYDCSVFSDGMEAEMSEPKYRQKIVYVDKSVLDAAASGLNFTMPDGRQMTPFDVQNFSPSGKMTEEHFRDCVERWKLNPACEILK